MWEKDSEQGTVEARIRFIADCARDVVGVLKLEQALNRQLIQPEVRQIFQEWHVEHFAVISSCALEAEIARKLLCTSEGIDQIVASGDAVLGELSEKLSFAPPLNESSEQS